MAGSCAGSRGLVGQCPAGPWVVGGGTADLSPDPRNRSVGTLLGTLEAHPRVMERYYCDDDITIYHADLRDVPDVGPVACVVTSPPYNGGVCYDVHHDAMAGEEYRSLAASAAALMASSLRAENGRAWVNTGVTQLHTWLDALEEAGFGSTTTVAWDYGLSTAD